MTAAVGIVRRLHNWGRWRWRDLMAGAPNSSCVNPLYQGMIPGGGEGYGDAAEAQKVEQDDSRQEGPEVDEEDAESLGCWIRQLPEWHRTTLHQRFVLRAPHATRVGDAVNALALLMDENLKVNQFMRRCG